MIFISVKAAHNTVHNYINKSVYRNSWCRTCTWIYAATVIMGEKKYFFTYTSRIQLKATTVSFSSRDSAEVEMKGNKQLCNLLNTNNSIDTETAGNVLQMAKTACSWWKLISHKTKKKNKIHQVVMGWSLLHLTIFILNWCQADRQQLRLPLWQLEGRQHHISMSSFVLHGDHGCNVKRQINDPYFFI